MKKKMLIVSSDNPYPEVAGATQELVIGGFEKLILDYEKFMFDDYDVYLLLLRPGLQLQLSYQGNMLPYSEVLKTLAGLTFEFVYLIEPRIHPDVYTFLFALLRDAPSFCFVQRHPDGKAPDENFRGMVTHSSSSPHRDVLTIGGSFHPDIFYPKRQTEEFVLCTARIKMPKNQLELVHDYKKRIYDRYGVPLMLVGGCDGSSYFDKLYWEAVSSYVDGVSVLCTADPQNPRACESWRTSSEVAALCNRSRFFVMPSPKESFCIAMVEAMACGTTCVVNGQFTGFEPNDLQPHVFGNITGKDGSIVDLLDEAFKENVRIDASEWVKKFSLPEIRKKLIPFIQSRLNGQHRTEVPLHA